MSTTLPFSFNPVSTILVSSYICSSRSRRVNHTGSVIKEISEVAGSAGPSISIPLSTLITDGCADVVGIEEIFRGASSADSILEITTSVESRG